MPSSETGLAYNRFRYYSVESGCYISQDPILLDGGFNVYAYVHDINSWIDPFGENGTPTLPNSQIVNQNGVVIEHYYPNDHAPAHAHVFEEGKKNRATKIGENGKPLKGQRALSPKEAKVVKNNKTKIRKSISKIRKWLGFEIHGQAYFDNKKKIKGCH